VLNGKSAFALERANLCKRTLKYAVACERLNFDVLRDKQRKFMKKASLQAKPRFCAAGQHLSKTFDLQRKGECGRNKTSALKIRPQREILGR
jgi:hypothetical protein